MKYSDPFKILTPNERWAPSQSQMDAFQDAYEKLLPPLVYKIRLAVTNWRENDYQGASETSKTLMNFWFNQEHLVGQTKFSFFFSQRETIESIIYLYEIAEARDKIAENQPFLIPKKSVFNKIIGDNPFELELASFLEYRFYDVVSFAKNTMGEGGVNFKMEYQAKNGNIREYYPDFFVKTQPDTFFILETKGREDLDDLLKIKRLAIWCKDINKVQSDYTYTPIYVKQEKWEDVKNDLKSFNDVIRIFKVER